MRCGFKPLFTVGGCILALETPGWAFFCGVNAVLV